MKQHATSPTPSSPAPPNAGFDATTRTILILLGTVVFIAVVNGTMINVALPHIGRDFGVSEGTYGWLVTGYTLTFGIFSAINGRLADMLGKKRLYMFGILMLGLNSLAVAASPYIELAIALRFLQGAGAAALPVLGTSIIKEIVSPQQQGKAVGYILSTVGVAASIGPFLGGVIVQFAHWRVVFMITGLVLVMFPLALKVLPESLNEVDGKNFDWVGALLLSAGIGALLYGFEMLENRAVLWMFLTTIGVGVGSLVAFGFWIMRKDNPFAHPATFKRTKYLASCVAAATTNAARFGTVVLTPIFLTEINHLEPLGVGAVLFPGAVMIALLSARAGNWADRVGARMPVVVGMIAMILGALVSAVYAGGSPIGVGVGMTLFGVGFAFTQSPLVSAVNRMLPREEAGSGVGLFMMIFFVGGAAGVAASVTAIELQPPMIDGLFGLTTGARGKFTNAILMLSTLLAVGMLFAPMLPAGAEKETKKAA
mgnify:FL=1